MKKFFLCIAVTLTAMAAKAADNVIILDLTKSTTPLEFNATNGSWTGTYSDDDESIESQVFSFFHGSMSDWATWWGFTASNSADNTRPENTLTHQWSNMAAGGIVLDENGEIKFDSFGAPEVSSKVPYIVGFVMPTMSARPGDLTFNTGKFYEPVGVYVNLNSYAYYSMVWGDSFARAFTNGDKFTLTIHGVGANESEKTVDVTLGSCSNGDLTLTRGWKYVDLTSLGAVNELYFTLSSTDSGAYGMNTPAYFCLDKLMVKEASNVNSTIADITDDKGDNILYDRDTHTISLRKEGFAIIYNTAGNMVGSFDSQSHSIEPLPRGVYIVKSGNSSLKVVR